MKIVRIDAAEDGQATLKPGMLVSRSDSQYVYLLIEETRAGYFSYFDLQNGGSYHKEGLFRDFVPYKGTLTISN